MPLTDRIKNMEKGLGGGQEGVKVLATKSDDPSSIPGSHHGGRRVWTSMSFLLPSKCILGHVHMCGHTHFTNCVLLLGNKEDNGSS